MNLPGSEFGVRQLDAAVVMRRASELVVLRRCAYTVEAELIGDDRIPQLSESEEQLVSAALTWHVADRAGDLVAAIAYTSTPAGIDIERLVVHPAWHRRGLARDLVASLPYMPAVVSTGRDNIPARKLYELLGFVHVGDAEIVPQLWISRYRRP